MKFLSSLVQPTNNIDKQVKHTQAKIFANKPIKLLER